MALFVAPQARSVVPELGRSSISKHELSTKFKSDLVLSRTVLPSGSALLMGGEWLNLCRSVGVGRVECHRINVK